MRPSAASTSPSNQPNLNNVSREACLALFDELGARVLAIPDLGWRKEDINTLRRVLIEENPWPLDAGACEVIETYRIILSVGKPIGYIPPKRAKDNHLDNVISLKEALKRKVNNKIVLRAADLVCRLVKGYSQDELNRIPATDRMAIARNAVALPVSGTAVGCMLFAELGLPGIVSIGIGTGYVTMDTLLLANLNKVRSSQGVAVLLKSVRGAIMAVMAYAVVGATISHFKASDVRGTFIAAHSDADPTKASIKQHIATAETDLKSKNKIAGSSINSPTVQIRAQEEATKLQEEIRQLYEDMETQTQELEAEADKAYGAIEKITTAYVYVLERADRGGKIAATAFMLLVICLDLFGIILNSHTFDSMKKVQKMKQQDDLAEGLEQKMEELQKKIKEAEKLIAEAEKEAEEKIKKIEERAGQEIDAINLAVANAGGRAAMEMRSIEEGTERAHNRSDTEHEQLSQSVRARTIDVLRLTEDLKQKRESARTIDRGMLEEAQRVFHQSMEGFRVITEAMRGLDQQGTQVGQVAISMTRMLDQVSRISTQIAQVTEKLTREIEARTATT